MVPKSLRSLHKLNKNIHSGVRLMPSNKNSRRFYVEIIYFYFVGLKARAVQNSCYFGTGMGYRGYLTPDLNMAYIFNYSVGSFTIS